MVTTIPISVLSISGAFLVLTLVPSYFRARNIPVILSVFWLASASICTAVNTIAWQGNPKDKYRVWCEISIRIIYASTFAVQCCSALLLRRLEAIAATRYVSMSETAKRRRNIVEFCFGLGLPILYLALAIVNMGHRYDLVQCFGPVISIYPTALSVIFTTAPVLLASVISSGYAILCSYWLFVRRRQLSAALSSSGSGINKQHFVKLFALSCVEICWTVPLAFVIQISNLLNRQTDGPILFPYTSWSDVHWGFERINVFTIKQLEMTAVGRRNLPIIYLGSLSSAITCLIFFAFLGTSTEFSKGIATWIRGYWKAITRVVRPARHNKKQVFLQDDSSLPPLSPNEDYKMKQLDDTSGHEFQIEVRVERTTS
nr:putative pheromone receptor [Pseudozyma pruni]